MAVRFLAGFLSVWQDVDKVNRLPDAEKPCKTRKRGLQMRAHTWTYVTDFAARVDEVSRNFNFS